jgi:hypothetical protein
MGETRVDEDTKAAIKRMAGAVDAIAGMVAGCAAYVAALEGAHYVDRRRAMGVAQTLLPEGLTGDRRSAGLVANAMIEEIAKLAREINDVQNRSRTGAPRPLTRDFQGKPQELNPNLEV